MNKNQDVVSYWITNNIDFMTAIKNLEDVPEAVPNVVLKAYQSLSYREKLECFKDAAEMELGSAAEY